MPENLVSPQLATLKQDIENGKADALTAFWNSILQTGAPLIEPSEDDADKVWVTFLWRAKEETRNVVIIGGLAGWDVSQSQMTRLLNADLWHKSYLARKDLRMTYRLSANDSLINLSEVRDWKQRTATWQPDPLNPRQFVFPKNEEEPDDEETYRSILELPDAPAQLWIKPRPNVPRGNVTVFRLHSAILDNTRRVWVYTPPDYSSVGEPYPMLILLDGWDYVQVIPTPTMLDNLIAEKRIPPLVAILPSSLDQKTRSRELACFPPFVEFLTRELVPWAREHFHVTGDAAKTIVGGSSLGGLTAAFAGLTAPEYFGNLLSQSGSFWWKPDDEMESEWLSRQFALTHKLPLRFYLDAGLLETGNTRRNGPSMLVVNRHMRNVLQAKGYPGYYAEHNGGHDYLCWQGTLAEGLIALLGKEIRQTTQD